MKNILLAAFTLLIGATSFSQEDCYKKLEDAFAKRGSYTVADEMHRNVIVSFFTPDGNECRTGKARVENGTVVSVFFNLMTTLTNRMKRNFTMPKNCNQ